MKKDLIKILTLGLSLFLITSQLSAQMIPKEYFEPKAGGTPKSNFYTIFSYDIGFIYDEAQEKVGESNVGMEGMNLKFFFPNTTKKGYTIDVNYNKSVQAVQLTDFGWEDFGFETYKPILSNSTLTD